VTFTKALYHVNAVATTLQCHEIKQCLKLKLRLFTDLITVQAQGHSSAFRLYL